MQNNDGKMIEVFHTGFLELQNPDVHYGRTNADFGQGFYVTPDADFASRWAKFNKDQRTVVNKYTLNTDGLRVHRFERSEEWFRYIFRNRRGYKDELEADIVIGPIANDTIYDTLGIFTSGMLSDELALEMLKEGPEYVQIALKTEAAAKQLTWTGSFEISDEEIFENRKALKAEQDRYLRLISGKIV